MKKSFEANFSPNLTAKCIKWRLVEYTPAEFWNEMRIGLLEDFFISGATYIFSGKAA